MNSFKSKSNDENTSVLVTNAKGILNKTKT